MTLALRLDDVGASSKQFEVYSRLPFGNILGLKATPPFRAWGPYRELNAAELTRVLALLEQFGAQLTVGTTAAWVAADGTLTPFPEKYPELARVMQRGVAAGLLEVANHGLTHCVVGQHRPRPFAANRRFHREFWPWVPVTTQEHHLSEAQRILTDAFGPIVTFVPPGNVWTKDTERIAARVGLRYLASLEAIAPTRQTRNGVTYLGSDHQLAFHDRELVLEGLGWLAERLADGQRAGYRYVTVRAWFELHA